MAYFAKGHNIDDEADDFDEYDPTPYGGGYDIRITYGHPLPPSDEICHPPSQNCSDEPAEYTSYADVSGYDNEDAVNNEYSSYARRPRKKQDDEEEAQEDEVVDEYEQPAEKEEEEESEGYGRSEEDEYGGRTNYGGDNYGGEEDEEKEHHRRTYYDD